MENTDMENRVPAESEIPETALPTAAPQIPVEKPAEPAAKPNAGKKKGLRVALIAGAAVLLIAAILVAVFVVVPMVRYSSAEKAFDNGEYKAASDQFAALGAYKDAPARAIQAGKAYHYYLGKDAFDAGNFDDAREEFEAADDYKDAEDMVAESILAGHYSAGVQAVADGEYEKAIGYFRDAGAYQDAVDKMLEAYDLRGSELLDGKNYLEAAAYFAESCNKEKRAECGRGLVETGAYTDGITILQDYTDQQSADYVNYANGMLCMDSGEFDQGIAYLKAANGLLDADEKSTECTFRIAEKCLADGYLNKAKALYETLPEGYTLDGKSAAERIELLSKNQKFLNLVGYWKATKTYYKVQANSTTSSYYYYWYQDAWITGTVTVTCPYNDANGTFSIVGKATYPAFQNFSTYSSKLKSDMETFSFNVEGLTTVPYNIRTSSTCTLNFGGSQFTLKYKFVDQYSSVYYHYTYTSDVTYGKHSSMSEDML